MAENIDELLGRTDYVEHWLREARHHSKGRPWQQHLVTAVAILEGSCCCIICVMARSTSGGRRSVGHSGKHGSRPAARSASFCSRRGTPSTENKRNTISTLGCARPDSRKLTWREETSASRASSSWERPRRPLQYLSSAGKSRLFMR